MTTYIFDFDDTIFDTQALKDLVSKKFTEYGVSEEDAINLYKKTSLENNGNYVLEKHIDNLVLNMDKSMEIKQEILNWFYDLDLSKYVLPGSENLLIKLSDKNDLILLTKGGKDFQTIKIEGSGLGKYFKEINITSGLKEDFLLDKKYGGEIYFINDKDSENEIIRTKFPNIKIINPKQKGDITASLMDSLE